jgi:hypothetical protein
MNDNEQDFLYRELVGILYNLKDGYINMAISNLEELINVIENNNI